MTDTADYYVATDGDDGSTGSESNPLATVHEAVDRMEAGDLTYVRGGTYEHTNGNPVYIGGKSGTSSSPIRLAAYPDERPHVRWEGGSTQWDMQGGFELDDGASHWVFEGLEISHSPALGIRTYGGQGNTYRDLVLHDNGNSGIQAHGDNCTMVGIESHSNHDETDNGEDADGLVMAQVSGGLMENCVCYNNSDDGIDLYESENLTVRDVVVHDNGYDTDGDGNGLKSANTDVGGNNRFERCVAYNNSNHGFRNYCPKPDTVVNCTSFNNDGNSFAAIHGGDHEIVNCIEYQNSSDTSFHDGVNHHHNTWNLGISDPQFVSTNDGDSGFLRLSEGSPAIDVGTEAGVEYNGDAPDLGAYEFESSSGGSSPWTPVTVHYYEG